MDRLTYGKIIFRWSVWPVSPVKPTIYEHSGRNSFVLRTDYEAHPVPREVHPLVEKPFESGARLEPSHGPPHRSLLPLVTSMLDTVAS